MLFKSIHDFFIDFCKLRELRLRKIGNNCKSCCLHVGSPDHVTNQPNLPKNISRLDSVNLGNFLVPQLLIHVQFAYGAEKEFIRLFILIYDIDILHIRHNFHVVNHKCYGIQLLLDCSKPIKVLEQNTLEHGLDNLSFYWRRDDLYQILNLFGRI